MLGPRDSEVAGRLPSLSLTDGKRDHLVKGSHSSEGVWSLPFLAHESPVWLG